MKKVFVLIFIILNVLLLSSCKKTEFVKETIMLENVFSISPYIVLHANESDIKDIKDKIKSELDEILKELDNKYDCHDDNSFISYINNNAYNEDVTLDDESKYIIESALGCSKSFGGAYDISIYPLIECWDFTNKYYDGVHYYNPPEDEKINELLELVDYNNVVIEENKIRFLKEGMKIDLGSCIKGYACDKIADHMDSNYPNISYILNIGGNVLTSGSTIRNDEKDSFNIAIQTPFSEVIDKENTYYIGYVKAKTDERTTVVTSGIYERYIKDDKGNMYHHILDPKTGKPVDNNIESVTMVFDGKNASLFADICSTGYFAYDPMNALDESALGRNWLGVVVVTKDKSIIISSSLENRFVFNEDLKDYYKFYTYYDYISSK